jgi:IclR family acetate operon transcriptional repressor
MVKQKIGSADAAQRRSGAQTVERALTVLRCFEGAATLGVREVATLTGMSPPTAFRLLRVLRDGGLLDQDPRTERYHLGLQTAVLGRLALHRLGVFNALPHLYELRDSTGEAVILGALHVSEVVIIAQLPSIHPLRFNQGPGTRNPAHVCAMGKALLAFEPETAIDELDLVPYTASTITDRDELLRQFAEIRTTGYSFNNEERTDGVRAIGAPVLGPDGFPVAAIALQAPSARLTIDRVEALAAQVQATARSLALTISPDGLPATEGTQ